MLHMQEFGSLTKHFSVDLTIDLTAPQTQSVQIHRLSKNYKDLKTRGCCFPIAAAAFHVATEQIIPGNCYADRIMWPI